MNEVEIIDSHAHMDYEYEVGVPELIAQAKKVGVSHIIAIAAEPDSLARVQALARDYSNLFHTSGIHPHEAKLWTQDLFAKVKEGSKSEKCVAIGELGLDFFYDHAPKDEQITALRDQLNYAVECGKPVVVHSREADDDTIAELTPFAAKWNARHPGRSPGVIHCFTSTRRLAEAMLQAGFYISFSGIITFKNAEPLRDIVRNVVPLDRLLVETDSPYLSPMPFRGQKNQPAHTRVVAEKVAELKGLPYAEIAKITRQNTIQLFQLGIA
jgi:TatD DNase family protein